ncbi:hypothetical protein B0T16DRAFT_88233 [Cercophora newfieldiana]|uniref:Uncharacterized protein n=1 Tax=Cercophora newfieldiana TaxID=92897 RepID=A0AA39YG95_9PEZI|nr:hypothetical protein B0T16DRAFT_88233 [Cercophora newfieldiana]
MDSRNGFEPRGPIIVGEKSLGDTSMPLRNRPTWANRPTPIRRIMLAGSVILLILLGLSTLPQMTSCHGPPPEQVEQQTGSFASRFRTGTPEGLHEFLQKYFPVRHVVEAVPHPEAAATILRLARRQDNTTESSTPPSTPTPTPTPTPSSTSSTSSSSSSSATSSPPPPPPRTEPSTTPTTTTPPATTTSTTPPANEPPPADPTVSAATVENPGTEPGATVTNPGTLTRSTTRDRNGVNAQGSTRTTTRSSKMLVATVTSTMPNGNVVVVTSTTYVPPDPVTTFGSTTIVAPSLHNGATRPRVDGMFVATLVVALAGAVFGAAIR